MNIIPAPLAVKGPSRAPTPEMGPWLQLFLALLLQLAGLPTRSGTAEGREALHALNQLRDLLALYSRGELPMVSRAHARRMAHGRTPEMRARLPRSQRRIQLVPGIFAALYFTPRAAIAARARFAALLRAPAARPTPFSKISLSTLTPTLALFVTISY